MILLPEVDTSSERSDAVVLGGGVELICIFDREFRAAPAAAAAGGLLDAMSRYQRSLSLPAGPIYSPPPLFTMSSCCPGHESCSCPRGARYMKAIAFSHVHSGKHSSSRSMMHK